MLALDPATGKQKWAFDPYNAPGDQKAVYEQARSASTCRGVTYWQAATPAAGPDAVCEKRIFKPDSFGNVYAIDADTGKSCLDFGAGKGHPGYVTHRDYENHGDGAYGMGSPPAIIGDIVVTTISANDGVQNANDGMVRAFDVRSGEMKWEFDPIPAEHVDDTGAANVWSTMSVDPDRNLVFVPTTSPSTDYYGGNRLFDIPLSDATTALDGQTGQVRWAFQIVHHDIYDFDLPGHPLLVTIKKDGRDIPVAIQQTKMGFLYVFDRDTGTPVFPIVEKPVPQTDIVGDKTPATQPMPDGMASFSGQHLTRDSMFGLTPIDRAWCRNEFDKMRYDGMYTPPSEKGSLSFPSMLGGGNWGGAAFDPTTNTLIVKAENLATRFALKKKGGRRRRFQDHQRRLPHAAVEGHALSRRGRGVHVAARRAVHAAAVGHADRHRHGHRQAEVAGAVRSGPSLRADHSGILRLGFAQHRRADCHRRWTHLHRRRARQQPARFRGRHR